MLLELIYSVHGKRARVLMNSSSYYTKVITGVTVRLLLSLLLDATGHDYIGSKVRRVLLEHVQ